MKRILTKLERLQNRADYADQYVDSIEFLIIGVALGVLGGIWGNVINACLAALFGDAYLAMLSLISLILLYFLSFPLRKARKVVSENISEISLIKREIELESSKNQSNSSNPGRIGEKY